MFKNHFSTKLGRSLENSRRVRRHHHSTPNSRAVLTEALIRDSFAEGQRQLLSHYGTAVEYEGHRIPIGPATVQVRPRRQARRSNDARSARGKAGPITDNSLFTTVNPPWFV